jgi:hypothetical protein
MNMYRCMRSLISAVVLVVLWGAPGHARHAELPNRIPEARETLVAAPHQDMLHVPDATQPNLGCGGWGIPVCRWVAAGQQRGRRRPSGARRRR